MQSVRERTAAGYERLWAAWRSRPAISTDAEHACGEPRPAAWRSIWTSIRKGSPAPKGSPSRILQDTSVELPEGLTIDPSAGVGLGSCSPAQYAAATLTSPAGAGCPEDSKLGTVEIETPLLLTPIYGSLYVATPYENPFSEPGHPEGSFIALYVIARSRAERGILVKLAGKVTANPLTGRLSVAFEGDPPAAVRQVQLPLPRRRPGRADQPTNVWHIHHERAAHAVLRAGKPVVR